MDTLRSASAPAIHGAYLSGGKLDRFIPEPKTSSGIEFMNVLHNVGSFFSGTIPAGINTEFQTLLTMQLETQKQMQLVSMHSNIEKSRHETQMAAIRNIRVG